MKTKYLLPLLLIVACESQSLDYSLDRDIQTGTGGSMARFAFSGNYLYTVNDFQILTYDVTDEKSPVLIGEAMIYNRAQTIFVSGNLMFLGTVQGVEIYDISEPSHPYFISTYWHIFSCDPVVVKGNYAYATLRTEDGCWNGTNQLDIINVSNPSSPYREKSISMTNPKGLGISGNLLFVCDAGIKTYSIEDPVDPQYLSTTNINAFDVIPIDTLLLVATTTGLAQYSIGSNNQLDFLSSIYSQK